MHATWRSAVIGGALAAALAGAAAAAPRNLAVSGAASASSEGWGSAAVDANDGNRDPDFAHGSVWHTTDGVGHHWWQVDLGADCYLDRVQIFPRNVGPHWLDFAIVVTDSGGREVFNTVGGENQWKGGRDCSEGLEAKRGRAFACAPDVRAA